MVRLTAITPSQHGHKRVQLSGEERPSNKMSWPHGIARLQHMNGLAVARVYRDLLSPQIAHLPRTSGMPPFACQNRSLRDTAKTKSIRAKRCLAIKSKRTDVSSNQKLAAGSECKDPELLTALPSTPDVLSKEEFTAESECKGSEFLTALPSTPDVSS